MIPPVGPSESAAQIFEIVPNISEGRDSDVIDACIGAIAHAGASVIHRTSDPVHHRSVITAIGSGSVVVAAAVALARTVRDRVDLRRHRGAHPRIGALDVLPFVPLGAATLEEAVTLAQRAAGRIWRELGVPSFLYGEAATGAHRTLLADVRRGQFEGLATKLADPRWAFDYGDLPHPRAGAIAIGARAVLVAFNVELETAEIAVARRIATALRERDGGLRTLRALAIRLGPQRVQVSFNITDHAATPLYRVRELVRRLAAREGVAIGPSELIGLAPAEAIEWTARAYRSTAYQRAEYIESSDLTESNAEQVPPN
jgi:glutamate formiminotransferase